MTQLYKKYIPSHPKWSWQQGPNSRRPNAQFDEYGPMWSKEGQHIMYLRCWLKLLMSKIPSHTLCKFARTFSGPLCTFLRVNIHFLSIITQFLVAQPDACVGMLVWAVPHYWGVLHRRLPQYRANWIMTFHSSSNQLAIISWHLAGVSFHVYLWSIA